MPSCPTFDARENSAEGGNIAVFDDDFAIKESKTIEAKTEGVIEAQS